MITTAGCVYQDSAAYITEEGPREEVGARQRRRSSHGPLPRMAPRKSDLGTPTNPIGIAVKIVAFAFAQERSLSEVRCAGRDDGMVPARGRGRRDEAAGREARAAAGRLRAGGEPPGCWRGAVVVVAAAAAAELSRCRGAGQLGGKPCI